MSGTDLYGQGFKDGFAAAKKTIDYYKEIRLDDATTREEFLVLLLEGIEEACGDPQHPRHIGESYSDLYDRIAPYMGRYANACGADVTWSENDYHLAELWEAIEDR
jgi:hypothetical protein